MKKSLHRREQLVLFDIDGTILRYKKYFSKKVFCDIINELFSVDIPMAKLPGFSGMTDLRILKDIAGIIRISEKELFSALPELWKKLLDEFKKISNPDCIELLPGISELISLLHKDNFIHIGLLTGNFKDNAYLKLNVFGLGKYFPFGAFGEESEDRNKLASLAIERANSFFVDKKFSCDNTVIIGDSQKDIECAKANNIPVIIVATGGYSLSELRIYKPDAIFIDFNDYNQAYNFIINI